MICKACAFNRPMVSFTEVHYKYLFQEDVHCHYYDLGYQASGCTIKIHVYSCLSFRYHKNKREQKPGWNKEILQWCHDAAVEKNLKEWDFWGGFVIDEMKIEVTF